MKPLSYIKNLAIFLSLLIISLPIVFAYENNLVYDGNGNLVSGDNYYREYDELNQLVRIRNGNLSTSPVLEEFTWNITFGRVFNIFNVLFLQVSKNNFTFVGIFF